MAKVAASTGQAGTLPKLLGDCTEAERLERIHDARELLRQVFERGDEFQILEWATPWEEEFEADGELLVR